MQHTIQISSAIITNDKDELLVVRKRGSTYYMLPGGKIEHAESLIAALLRELKEEINLKFEAQDFIYLGKHSTQAANEKNTRVEGNIFYLATGLHAAIQVHAEIEDAMWLNKAAYGTHKLAHLLEEFAIPRWLVGNYKGNI